jgi:hypothetical protein
MRWVRTMSEHVEILGGARLRMAIPLANGERAFMRLDRYGSELRSLAVVVADSARFLQLWRASERAGFVDLARESPEQWRSDRKYPLAAESFAKSDDSAIPLARIERVLEDVQVEQRINWLRTRIVQERRPRVEFLDGVTRTIWLLANGAERIPFDCASLTVAEQFYDLVAATGTSIYIPQHA